LDARTGDGRSVLAGGVGLFIVRTYAGFVAKFQNDGISSILSRLNDQGRSND
jgi:hypothetical protein